jgi:hypothetical protein
MSSKETYIKAKKIHNNVASLYKIKLTKSMPIKAICEMIDDIESRGIEVKVVNSPSSYIEGKIYNIKTFKIGRNYPLELSNDTKVFYFYQWSRSKADVDGVDHSLIRFDTDVELLPWPPKMYRIYLYEKDPSKTPKRPEPPEPKVIKEAEWPIGPEMVEESDVTCGCVCECNRPVVDNDKLCPACQGRPKHRVNIKDILAIPEKKAWLMTQAIKVTRFFK